MHSHIRKEHRYIEGERERERELCMSTADIHCGGQVHESVTITTIHEEKGESKLVDSVEPKSACFLHSA